MTEEEIQERISICEDRRRGYLEVGNTKIAGKYSNEIYKWEQLLNKSDPKRDEQLRDYKIGYEHLKQVLNEIKDYINNADCCTWDNRAHEDILQMLYKVLGDDK